MSNLAEILNALTQPNPPVAYTLGDLFEAMESQTVYLLWHPDDHPLTATMDDDVLPVFSTLESCRSAGAPPWAQKVEMPGVDCVRLANHLDLPIVLDVHETGFLLHRDVLQTREAFTREIRAQDEATPTEDEGAGPASVEGRARELLPMIELVHEASQTQRHDPQHIAVVLSELENMTVEVLWSAASNQPVLVPMDLIDGTNADETVIVAFFTQGAAKAWEPPAFTSFTRLAGYTCIDMADQFGVPLVLDPGGATFVISPDALHTHNTGFQHQHPDVFTTPRAGRPQVLSAKNPPERAPMSGPERPYAYTLTTDNDLLIYADTAKDALLCYMTGEVGILWPPQDVVWSEILEMHSHQIQAKVQQSIIDQAKNNGVWDRLPDAEREQCELAARGETPVGVASLMHPDAKSVVYFWDTEMPLVIVLSDYDPHREPGKEGAEPVYLPQFNALTDKPLFHGPGLASDTIVDVPADPDAYLKFLQAWGFIDVLTKRMS